MTLRSISFHTLVSVSLLAACGGGGDRADPGAPSSTGTGGKAGSGGATGGTAGSSGNGGTGGSSGTAAGTAGAAGKGGGSAGKGSSGAGGTSGKAGSGGSSGSGGASGASGSGGLAGSSVGGSAGSSVGGSAGSGAGGSAGSGAGAGSAGTAGMAGTGAMGGSAGAAGCVPGGTQCTNCIDDDADGLIDAFDPECTGPADDDEKTFATGIPGDNVDCKQDCFFDGNSGAGANECYQNTKCDASNTDPKCPYDNKLSGSQCTNVPDCDQTSCLAFTPNGCDCFGCCAVPDGAGGQLTVKLTSTCTADKFTDPTACQPCTQSTACVNDCGTCELCVGKTTLPPECFSGAGGTGGGAGAAGSAGSGGIPNTCSGGATPCDQNSPCPVTPQGSGYCLTGCCVYGKP